MKIKLLEDYIFESKEDIRRFVDKFGQDIYDRLQRNKQRILNKTKDPKNVDITYLVKNASIEQIEEILAKAEDIELDVEGRPIPKPTHTEELVYNEDGIKAYKVYDVEDMIDIGRDTGWCIAGKYYTEDTKVSQAVHYFNEYKDRLNLECYYVFVKGNEKYCVLLLPNGNTSIWNKQDREVDQSDLLNEFGEAVEVIGLKDWSKETYIWNGKSKVPADVVNVKIAEGVTSVGSSAFWGCSGLTSIAIPDSVTSIEWGAFYRCCSLTNIAIPDSVTSIGEAAFSDCSSLTSITIPNGVLSIEAATFKGCSRLMNITIPNSVTSIGERAFDGCSSLKSISIPDGVTHIGYNVFYECISLKNITIPNGVVSIVWGMLSNCTSLTSITIPDSVMNIDAYSFDGCSRLTDVYYSGTEEQWKNIDIMSNGNKWLLGANIHFNS